MSKAIAEIAIGAGLVALDIFAPEIGLTLTPWLSGLLVGTGSSLVMGGIGSLLTKQQVGLGANVRSPIQPWNVVYGRSKIGGTVVYIEETGESDKYLHLVYVLACHPCQALDAVLFDGKRICLDTSGNSLSFGDSTSVIASQQTVNVASISRTNDVVTVVMSSAMPLPASTAAGPALMDGDTVQIQNVSTDQTLNGQYQIQVLNSTTFTYICGGNAVSITGQGQVKTTWPDYGDTVHVEFANGSQSASAPPFPGLLASGDTGSQGLWTSNHLLLGRTAVYLRLKYGGNTYASGMPTISFLLSGKNDIYDPRLGSYGASGTTGYTENSALCIADFLTNQTWGFKCAYGTDVPTANLISAANLCDESVPLANGSTEPRYTANGSFQLSAKRGEILQNLLTSCGGRLTYSGGQFVIHPAAWTGASLFIGQKPVASATISVVTSHIPGSASAGVVQLTTELPWTATFSNSLTKVFLSDNTAWTQRTDSTTWDPSTNTWKESGGLYGGQAYPDVSQTILSVSVDYSCIIGCPWNTPQADLTQIYDCYIDVVYADGSTVRLRPTQYRVAPSPDPTYAGLDNPANALDGDPTTCATIHRDLATSNNDCPILQLTNFVPISATPAVPDTSSAGIAASALALANAAGPFQWKPKVAVRDLYNGVKGTYVSPLNSWQASDFPPYAQDDLHGYSNGPSQYAYDANLAADGGDRRWYDIQLPFTISAATAQRLAKIELLRRRYQGAGTFAFNLAMYQLTALDIIAFTLPLLGWSNKLLEVSAHRFTVNKQSGNGSESMLLGTELDLQETDPSIYAWSASEELSPEGFQQGNLPTAQTISTVTAPATVTATNSTVTGTGLTSGQIQVSWSAPSDGYVSNGGSVIVQYSLDDTNWQALGTYDPSTTTAYIPNVSANQTYWVRVAYVNAAGAQSAWTVYGPITATGSTNTAVITLETNGTNNPTQTKLNLVSGSNVTLSSDSSGDVTIAASQSLVIGFVMASGATGTNVGPMLAAPRAGSLTKCVITVKASDSSTALTFKIKQNGTDIFSTDPTIAAGTASGTVTTSTSLTISPLTVAANDVFSIDISSGSSSWQFTAQLE